MADDYMDVEVPELKANLSSYLRLAGAGEIVTVTDHGSPIAVLGPCSAESTSTRGRRRDG